MKIEIEEVGLREGLQSNNVILQKHEKINLVEKMIDAGLNRIQLGSFVNPQKVPQMEGVDDLFKYFADHRNVVFSGLVLNKKGLLRAIDAGIKYVNISMSASETHQLENTGKSKAESYTYIEEMIKIAKNNGILVKGGIQAAFGCFYEGRISTKDVLSMVSFYKNSGVDEYNLSDTAGFATPGDVQKILQNVCELIPTDKISLHMHDTFGMGIVNIYEAMQHGVVKFDTSVAGMGGCPFMKGAAGNVPTEDFVYMLSSLDFINKDSLPDIAKLIDCANYTRQLFNRDFTGKVSFFKDSYNKFMREK